MRVLLLALALAAAVPAASAQVGIGGLIGDPTEGVRALVLCGRDDVQAASLPSVETIQTRMEEQRVNLRAQRMLRDLRRDAVVEYR